MHHLLIVDDNKNFANALATKLKREGYRITVVYDGDSALSEIQKVNSNIHLVLLDVNLGDPAFNGHQVCWEIKNLPNAPLVIMLTEYDSDHQHKLGLEHADDYVPKSWHQDVLVAHIRNRLKMLDNTKKNTGIKFIDDHLQIDTDKRIVYRDGQIIRLTPLENDLLRYLADRTGELVERDELLYAVWGEGYEGSTRIVDRHIATLRQKIDIDDDPDHPSYITTEHRFGYIFLKTKSQHD